MGFGPRFRFARKHGAHGVEHLFAIDDMEKIARHSRRSVQAERTLLSVTDAQGVCR